ncbi:MAG: ketosteroid isomerase [Magnetovibrio sp.]|nr:ketosteroid isomerase [Magnetovibrio sp.]
MRLMQTFISLKGLEMTKSTPARRLVEAFGNCEGMANMYSDDITWRLNHSLAVNIAGPHEGKEAVIKFNNAVFHKFYKTSSVSVEILDEIGDEASSVVRFNFHAYSARDHAYDVEYVLFAKTRQGLIYEVVELLDTLASNEQHQGNLLGVPPNSSSNK